MSVTCIRQRKAHPFTDPLPPLCSQSLSDPRDKLEQLPLRGLWFLLSHLVNLPPLLLLNSLFETQRTWTFHQRKSPPEIGSEGLLRDLHVIGDIHLLTGWLKPAGAHSLCLSIVHLSICPSVHLPVQNEQDSAKGQSGSLLFPDPESTQLVGARSSIVP